MGQRKKNGGAEVPKTGATKADQLGKYNHAEDFAFYSNCHGKSLKSLTWWWGEIIQYGKAELFKSNN